MSSAKTVVTPWTTALFMAGLLLGLTTVLDAGDLGIFLNRLGITSPGLASLSYIKVLGYNVLYPIVLLIFVVALVRSKGILLNLCSLLLGLATGFVLASGVGFSNQSTDNLSFLSSGSVYLFTYMAFVGAIPCTLAILAHFLKRFFKDPGRE